MAIRPSLPGLARRSNDGSYGVIKQVSLQTRPRLRPTSSRRCVRQRTSAVASPPKPQTTGKAARADERHLNGSSDASPTDKLQQATTETAQAAADLINTPLVAMICLNIGAALFGSNQARPAAACTKIRPSNLPGFCSLLTAVSDFRRSSSRRWSTICLPTACQHCAF